MPGFLELGLSPRVLRAIEAMGYEEPTPVQVQAIPRLLAGKDVVVQAQTGTGKTASEPRPRGARRSDRAASVPTRAILSEGGRSD
jgi:ATP-dependent RNA helicase DeaD